MWVDRPPAHRSHSSVTIWSGGHWPLVEQPVTKCSVLYRQRLLSFKGPDYWKALFLVLKTAALTLISEIAHVSFAKWP